MKRGEAFELESYSFLKNKYENDNIEFVRRDTADSTASDIEVFIHGVSSFFIEVKGEQAQSGQFVLIPDTTKKEFIFSPRNKSYPNSITDFIIEFMNKDFERFEKAGTFGVNININPNIFAAWIIDYYKNKRVKYVITKHNGNMIILPIEKFGTYFEVSAKFRIKKSGSSTPTPKEHGKLITFFTRSSQVRNIITNDGKIFVHGVPTLAKKTFTLDNNEYYLSPKGNTVFEVRRLSKTKNKNVIFAIAVKKDQDPLDLVAFEQDLKDI